MAGFFNAISAVLVIFMIMALGWVLGRLGWLTAGEKKFISKYVVNIAVPINCVTGVLGNMSREELLNSGNQALAAFVVVGLGLVFSAAVGKMLRLPRSRWGPFVVMGGVSNTMMIGIPVVEQLFGPAGLPSLMVYYLFSTIYTQTVAVMLCAHAGGQESAGKIRIGSVIRDLFRKPPVLGIITAFTLLLLDLQPPAMLMSAGKYVANTVTPLALIYSGFILYEVGVKNLRLLPGLPAMLVIRLVLAPVMCWGVCLLLGVTGLAREVFIVMAALPVMSQVPVLCGVYGADEKYAAIGASLSMLGMFVTLPVIMLLIG